MSRFVCWIWEWLQWFASEVCKFFFLKSSFLTSFFRAHLWCHTQTDIPHIHLSIREHGSVFVVVSAIVSLPVSPFWMMNVDRVSPPAGMESYISDGLSWSVCGAFEWPRHRRRDLCWFFDVSFVHLTTFFHHLQFYSVDYKLICLLACVPRSCITPCVPSAFLLVIVVALWFVLSFCIFL